MPDRALEVEHPRIVATRLPLYREFE